MMASPRTLLRFFLLFLLSVALLLTQQVSSAHALQHTLAQHQQQEKSAPHAHHCDLCALDAQLGSALPHSALVPGLASTSAGAPAHQAPVALAEPSHITPARGPPAASSV